MSRFNVKETKTGRMPVEKPALKVVEKPRTVAPTSPIRARQILTGTNHQGGARFENDNYGTLFRLGVNLMAGNTETYYEGGQDRDARFGGLVSRAAVADPQWTFDFLYWLRRDGKLRTAPVLGAVHALHARLAAPEYQVIVPIGNSGPGWNRRFISEIPNRLDEVMELFAMWQKLFPGEPFPQALKRGAGDALNRLLTEYSWLKYDTDSHDWRVADVLNIARVRPDDVVKDHLFRLSLATRYGQELTLEGPDIWAEFRSEPSNKVLVDETVLPMVAAHLELRAKAMQDPKVLLDPAALKAAGFTWSDALSMAGSRLPKAQLWEALIMGNSVPYEAMLKNLRNMQEAGIGRAATTKVQNYIANPNAVGRSGQLPYKFWAAYKNATGTQWAEPLEAALTWSVGNIPVLDGPTLGLIDTSGSMQNKMGGDRSTMFRVEVAAVFGAASALRNGSNFELHTFATNHAPVRFRPGDSLLRTIDGIIRSIGSVGHGTQTGKAVKDLYRRGHHRRVMAISDMQSAGVISPSAYVDSGTWFYMWDVAGYKYGDVPSGSGRIHQLSGLTDATLRTIPLVESGEDARWPWQNA